MIKTMKQLKGFINWAKDTGVKKVRLGDIEFELHDIAMISKIVANENIKTEPLSTSKTMVDAEQIDKAEEEDLMFWSAN